MSYSSPPCALQDLDLGFAMVSLRDVRTKRIYDAPTSSDGHRVLVDRIWPRGLTRQRAALNAWLRELAPSAELRKWFNHDPLRWTEFQRRYRAELAQQTELINRIRSHSLEQRVTLLYAARNETLNHALVLKQYIESV